VTHDIQEDGELSRTDFIDAASENTLRDNAEKVKVAREASAPQRYPDGNGGWIIQTANEAGEYPINDCVDCDDPIPHERLELGRIRCVPCQTLTEKRR
jgi:RNA polymerase-binding transcription factor DksA